MTRRLTDGTLLSIIEFSTDEAERDGHPDRTIRLWWNEKDRTGEIGWITRTDLDKIATDLNTFARKPDAAKCEGCFFFEPVGVKDTEKGICRRSPPTSLPIYNRGDSYGETLIETFFPQVARTDWCGLHLARAEEAK